MLIVDDSPMWRETLRRHLGQEPDIAVMAEAENGRRAVELARELVPDVIVMDLSMPVMDGIEATRRIHTELPAIRVLVLTQAEEDEDVVGAFRAGAIGYLLKDTSRDELVSGVRSVFQGEVVFTPRLANLVLAEIGHPTEGRPAPALTDRETLILKWLAQGRDQRTIATRFSLTENAVRNELRNIAHRLREAMRSVPARPGAGPVIDRGKIEHRPSPDRWRHPLRLGGGAKVALGILAALGTLLLVGGAAGRLAPVNRSVLTFLAPRRGHQLTTAMRGLSQLGSPWTIAAVRLGTLIVLVSYRRWQHAFAFVASFLLTGAVVSLLTSGTGPIHIADRFPPSTAIAGLTVSLLGAAYGLAPAARLRRIGFAATFALVAALGFADVFLGRTSFSGGIASVVLGAAIPILAFGIIAPEAVFPITYTGPQGARVPVDAEAIKGAMRRQLGMTVLDVKPLGAEGSGGSMPFVILVQGHPGNVKLFGKLYAVKHMRSDRLYKLGRMALYGSLEDEKPFNSVRRLAEYEDYILRYMEDSGIPTADPYGVIELEPELQYLLVTEFLEGGEQLLRPNEPIGRETVEDALSIVRALWNAGLAHRDIKPSNLLIREGKIYLIDAAFCQVRPSPWRQAVDLANMMLVLALRVDPQIVYDEARKQFDEGDIAEAFAATHSVTMPAQVRDEMKKEGRDLVGTFRALAGVNKPIGIQRWSVRRVTVTGGSLAVIAVSLALAYSSVHRFLTR